MRSDIDSLFRVCTIVALFCLIALLVSLFHSAQRINSEISRKLLHLGGGCIALLLPVLFDSLWWPFILCFTCAVFIAVTKHFNLFPAVHAIDRSSCGAVLFPLAIIITLSLSQLIPRYTMLIFFSAMATLTFADLAAALIGKQCKRAPKGVKTIQGSTAFLVIALLVNICAVFFFSGPAAASTWYLLAVAIVCSLTATATEAISPRGLDNLSIPLVIVLCQTIFLN